ncbi:MAG: glycoside hydrolase family 3 C-terminal domain-containing protein [Acidobacteriaceae bacterium]
MTRRSALLPALVLFLSFFATSAATFAQAPVPDSPAIEHRIDAMLQKLTTDEKIQLIGGHDSMFTFAAPSIGLPELKMSDGPLGVRTWGPSTAYPAGVALAATWDPKLAEREGVALGQDARARGVNFLLGPGVNIYRAPMNGRNFEYLGEDPTLAAHMDVAYIDGVQSQGVCATVKHFDANNSEYDRHNINSVIDERTLHELYLPAFKAAVQQGHVCAVMDSYNLVNGEHMTQNKELNINVLKKDWGFKGLLMSDWVATYDGVAAANGGLDLEMPDAAFMNAKNLLPALKSGAVTEATLDDKVRRLLRVAFMFHFIDLNGPARPQLDTNISLDNQHGAEVSLDGARESLTLLKNEGDLLPLNAARIHTIAVIGPDASPAVSGGGGSSNVTPFQATSILDGLSNSLAGKVNVLYSPGLPSIEDIFDNTRFTSLKREVFAGDDTTGTPTTTTPHRIAGHGRMDWAPRAKEPQTIRYTGVYTPTEDGPYLFVATATGEDRFELEVDGKTVLNQTHREGHAPLTATLPLHANQPIHFTLTYHPWSVNQTLGFGISSEHDLIDANTRKIAASADAVILSVGFGPHTESEGFDRTFELPFGQDQLIQAVSAVNKHTIVVITAGGAVDAQPWINSVPAVLHNFYPGQNGGTALAEVLFGQRSPEGRLPFSFDRSWATDPDHNTYYPAGYPNTQPDAKGDITVDYTEGLYNGYRYYTSNNLTPDQQPLFPFGFGLTYTTFRYSHIKAAVSGTGDNTAVTVSVDVTNTGKRAGSDVVQLYVGDPSAKAKRPVKELKGFSRINLAPGATQRVEFHLASQDLAWYNPDTHHWQVDPGAFKAYAGGNSAATPEVADFTVAP